MCRANSVREAGFVDTGLCSSSRHACKPQQPMQVRTPWLYYFYYLSHDGRTSKLNVGRTSSSLCCCWHSRSTAVGGLVDSTGLLAI